MLCSPFLKLSPVLNSFRFKVIPFKETQMTYKVTNVFKWCFMVVNKSVYDSFYQCWV